MFNFSNTLFWSYLINDVNLNFGDDIFVNSYNLSCYECVCECICVRVFVYSI